MQAVNTVNLTTLFGGRPVNFHFSSVLAFSGPVGGTGLAIRFRSVSLCADVLVDRMVLCGCPVRVPGFVVEVRRSFPVRYVVYRLLERRGALSGCYGKCSCIRMTSPNIESIRSVRVVQLRALRRTAA